MIPSFTSSSIKSKFYNIFFNTFPQNNCVACGAVVYEKNKKHNLGEYCLCSEDCNKNYYIDILCSSK